MKAGLETGGWDFYLAPAKRRATANTTQHAAYRPEES